MCHMTGIPEPTAFWTCNDEIINESSVSYEVYLVGRKYKLSVQQVAPCHAGQYSYTATNAAGRATTSASIMVIREKST